MEGEADGGEEAGFPVAGEALDAGGLPADRAEGPGLRLVPAEGVLPRFEGFLHWPSAACDGDEIGHRGGTAFRRPAEVEGVLVLLAGGKAADQQELPRVRGRGERPVAVAGPFLPVPA